MLTMVGWVAAAAIVSWLAAWLIRGRAVKNRVHALQAEARVKYEQLRRDLETRLSRVENDLLGAKDGIQVRDRAIAERDKLIRQQTEQLAAGLSQIAAASAERDNYQGKGLQLHASLSKSDEDLRQARILIGERETRLAENDSRLAQLQPLPAKLSATEAELRETKSQLESTQARVRSQDQEVSRLHKRTVELEPLTIQIKDRQNRLVELEARLAEAVRLRDAEIAQLKKKISELESLSLRSVELEAKRTQLASELNTLRHAKDEEIESLQMELRAIPALKRKLVERDRQTLAAREQSISEGRERDLANASLKSTLAERDHELDEKDSAIGRMYQRLAELAPLPQAVANHSARALELERGIGLRENRLRQLAQETAGLRSCVLEWMRLGGALPARDAEIARLRARLKELGKI